MQPRSRFLVRIWRWPKVAFQDVSSLEPQAAEHRAKVPSVYEFGNVMLTRGVIARNAIFWEWIGHGEPHRVPIKRLDKHGRVAAISNLTNARPVKVTAPDLKANGDDVAIESIVVAHQGLHLLS